MYNLFPIQRNFAKNVRFKVARVYSINLGQITGQLDVVIQLLDRFYLIQLEGPDDIRLRKIHTRYDIQLKIRFCAIVVAIISFVYMLLDNTSKLDVLPILFGGNLLTFDKKPGGIRPGAINYIFGRIAAKCASNFAIKINYCLSK